MRNSKRNAWKDQRKCQLTYEVHFRWQFYQYLYLCTFLSLFYYNLFFFFLLSLTFFSFCFSFFLGDEDIEIKTATVA